MRDPYKDNAYAIYGGQEADREHADQLRSEWVKLDGDIYMLSLDAQTDFDRKVVDVLRSMYARMEHDRGGY
jgi:hypothetical protein